MAEVLFYHLTQTPLERMLPQLLEKSLQRGWRVLVKCGDAARLDFLNTTLWTYREDTFLPHGTADDGQGADQPVYLSAKDEEPNNADVLMLVDGATYPVENMERFTRICVLFDGNDVDAVSAARVEWKAVTTAKLPAKYWAQRDGRWVEKAKNTSE
ncbi:MAG: DNA polymerase III subunit chi [Paracoccaceae bacterium]